MSERWATLDCFGTLIDWNGGIRSELARLWPDADVDALLERYHEVEPRVQLDGSLPYRVVLAQSLRLLAESEGLKLSREDETVLAGSLPKWPVFPEVPGELTRLRERGWRLGILSNTDRDLLAASLERIGVPVDAAVTAADAGSYKPAHGHWRRFRERAGEDVEQIHVAASLFHDIAPAAELGIPSVWVNRLDEQSDLPRAAELRDLNGLTETLDSIA
ncbi:MAG: HAD hydrolase-like protein [Actinobacteria bacterium]|nr:HAD hydrolase-like protein [Actinomycetota bacterium]